MENHPTPPLRGDPPPRWEGKRPSPKRPALPRLGWTSQTLYPRGTVFSQRGLFLAGEAEGGELKISSRKELEEWLKSLPPEQGQRVAAAIAARAALRVACLADAYRMHKVFPLGDLSTLMFVTFSLAAVVRAATQYPNRANELRDSAESIIRDSLSLPGFTNPVGVNVRDCTVSAARSALYVPAPDIFTGWAGFCAASIEYATFAAANAAAASTQTFFAEAVVAARDDAAKLIWASVAGDLSYFASGSAPKALASKPLWPDGEPPWARDLRVSLRFALPPQNDWQVWFDWYDRRLAGVSDPEEVELVFATVPESERAKGPAAANRWIRDRLEELQKEALSQQPAASWDFFISYSTHDEADAREVAAVIEQAGYSTFAQFKDMATGNNFVREMQAGLDDSGRVIALYSPNYEKSDHCQAEWSAAYNSDPSGRQRKLIPLLLRPTALNPLARQIVYKSLVGLSKEQRGVAILEAIAPKPAKRDVTQIRAELAETASPQPALNDTNQLDAGPNKVFDKPFVDQDLVELPYIQRTLIKTIRRALPPNAPKILDSALRSYDEELQERGLQPIIGILKALASALEKEIESIKATEPELLGVGNADLFESFLENHGLLVTHFPLKNEEKFADIPIDETEATGDALIQPIAEVSEKMQEMVQVGLATQNIGKITENSAQFAKDIAPLPPDIAASDPGSRHVTLKRRYVLGTLGFLVALYNILGSTASILATEQGAALFQAVGKAIEELSKFLI
ncbi:toll/interleukin-1 receptor domain-containing protein [Methylocystis heyeri]|uniref:toll/interleukin-1 receptor domain-containing protein n=1 Tax=Methylocystis heyeri TaxID=391905 RepID=UPI00138A033C|nr:toll/interleukin-1 receptor domain-containing protein [Methylocystis heyeri]